MAQLADSELTELGGEVARQMLGVDKVKQVEVVARPDSTDEPACYFWYQVDQDPASQSAALARIRLAQRLRDELLARGDATYPYIRVLSTQDWAKRTGA
jgi:hypothetical protein